MAWKQRQAAEDFTTTFPLETTQSWARMVKKWETNPSYPNPYISKEHGKCFLTSYDKCLNSFSPASKVSAVRLRLAQEETEGTERGGDAINKVSASVFMRMGLELEDQQYDCLFIRCLMSDIYTGTPYRQHPPERRARMPRRQHFSNVGVHFSTKSRSGVNFR